jgi:tripartite-type tricarboxylate transporter receptor subunit TctC
MTLSMKQLALHIPVAVAVAAVATAGVAHAQGDKVLRLVVPFPPGGGTDSLARALSRRLQADFGDPVIVENRPGAGGNIALDYVAGAAPNGRTLVLTTNSLVINPLIYSNLKFNAQTSFAPVIALAHSPVLILGRPGLPFKTLPEMVAYAKAHPGKLSYGSCGNGSIHQLAGEQLKALAGIDMLHVPYKGCGGAMTDLAGGQVDISVNSLTSAAPFLNTNKVVGLATTNAAPSRLVPGLPTVASSGLKNYSFDGWYAMFAPAGTPEAVVRRLNDSVNAALSDAEVKKALAASYLEPLGGSPADLAALVARETASYAPIVKAANITGD